TIRFELSGRPVSADIHVDQSLVEVLHEHFALLGARESCGQGLCGCCSGVVNGRAAYGCRLLAAFADGAAAVPVEGLEPISGLSPVQQAFVAAGAFQCGYCTPGFIVMTTQLLSEHPEPTDAQIGNYLTGNLCRCAAYPEIIQAVKLAADRLRAS